MKKVLFSVLALAGFSAAVAQTKAKTAPVKAATVTASPIKTLLDSFSYAAGYNIAMNMKEQGITSVNTALVQRALSDVFQNKKSLLTPEQTNACLQDQLKIFGEKKEKELKAPGLAFLEANKKKPGITVLPSGLQYEILTKATEAGPKPKPEDTVVVNYVGSLINGTEFENSYKNGQTATFPLNRVISGWTQILQLMTIGDKWKVYIPTEMAYGMNPRDPKTIPPGSVLIFEISLEAIKPAVPHPAQ